MTYLITGGAGYIGSHVVRAMTQAGERVVVLDDLSTGYETRVPEGVPLVVGSTLDREVLDRTIAEHGVTGVVHLAAKKQVGESVELPLHYYRENVIGLTVLLEAVAAAGVRNFLFSSSASVYGMPDVDLVTEETPCLPLSPYGETKLAGEWLVRAAGAAHGISTACLRYFNVAGAATPELADTGVFNLVPMVFERLDAGEAPRIFGDDYDTPDGTCVRDYIHVEDLADAHLVAARKLAEWAEAGEPRDLTINIGRGEGVSVTEMVALINEITGHTTEPLVTPRRPGDPARVVASADRIAGELGWKARHDVRDMIESAWAGWVANRAAAAV
ncbi:UDP-glucose 4-epimerase GalE [Streptomyces cinereoruber]|uniref:UDP-glucose 4-epimerase n=1 Tax=Streptomyces cinereoruber TaxID=67260 RepID=A0AAV4KMH4_9ACTN|nr:UDP-glucose 4-epimerase GalE [Streptomyces cinereoruber]MBB4156284.1 UDP-glucose 4-epimerase [Streptomyces cinereoruber]MBY8815867.1 UDP-glucose 4-epimerase GalE [Streptomyces cinereoruber]NIH65095.1 UDP-glucose 4-epimerase [Streptomyces cinereoruber]QEV32742.1 UDP-glucose 4-epimerase GalE [Streptomyces cinereoruber]GGR40075.1 UDP-glucose 4-epimerase GalE [Streptomyces cinereoruber]